MKFSKKVILVAGVLATLALRSQSFDVAAYIWPAYQPDSRWSELGIFAAGKGEWQNVWEAVPKWPGHNQPLKPLWGYENEADPKVVEKKIEAAISHGVNVFIYDWYWYGHRPFLEDALNNGFLGAKNNTKMKFFIMWANHNVNRLWDNRVVDKLRDGVVWSSAVDSAEFDLLIARWINQYFKRPNYYRIGGKPVLMIYELSTFINGIGGLEKATLAINRLRSECEKAGLGGVHLMICDFGTNPKEIAVIKPDSATIYNFIHWAGVKNHVNYADWTKQGATRFDRAKGELKLPVYFPHASVGWDTNPRYPKHFTTGTVTNSTPAEFEVSLKRAKDWANKNIPPQYPRLITINSWNEWTEGSYLEPDTTFGFGYLEAIKRVFGE